MNLTILIALNFIKLKPFCDFLYYMGFMSCKGVHLLLTGVTSCYFTLAILQIAIIAI